MGVSIRIVNKSWQRWLASAVLIAVTGCQSMPMAFRHFRDRDGAYAVDVNDAGRTSSGKRGKWFLGLKKKRAQPTEAIAQTVSAPTDDAAVAATSAPSTTDSKQPRFRLRAPSGARTAKVSNEPGLPVASIPHSGTAIPALPELPMDDHPQADPLPEGQGVELADESDASLAGERLDELMLTSIVGAEELPGELAASVNDAEAPSLPDAAPPAAAETPVPEESIVPLEEAPEGVALESESMYLGDGVSGVLTEPLACGVGPDGRGLWDNFYSRVGATYYDNGIDSNWGALTTLESTWQLCQSNWFMHAGIAGEAINDEYPLAFSAGLSRLAKVVGCTVEKPWIFGVSYDGYWDSEFYRSQDAVYLDQLRGIIGYAIKPCWDMGVWGAGGLSSDLTTIPGFGAAPNQYRTSIGDRVAGYSAWHWCQTGIYNMLSIGWEDGPGDFFVENDTFIPLTAACNFFVGGGYSNAYDGSTDLNLGLEFVIGRTCPVRWLAKKEGKNPQTVGKLLSDTLPKHSACSVAIDPCCVRYRGGWANDAYRSAFRVIPPTRFRRAMQFDPAANFLPVPPPPGNGGGGQQPPPPAPGGVVVDPLCPPNSNPLEVDSPRIDGRIQRSSRLSQWLEAQPNASHKGASTI